MSGRGVFFLFDEDNLTFLDPGKVRGINIGEKKKLIDGRSEESLVKLKEKGKELLPCPDGPGAESFLKEAMASAISLPLIVLIVI